MDISSIRSCRIHPAIGIARVGGSRDGDVVGPEIPGEQRTPPDPKYGFKDKHGLRLREAARFRVYDLVFDPGQRLDDPLGIAAMGLYRRLAARGSRERRVKQSSWGGLPCGETRGRAGRPRAGAWG